MFHTLMHWLKRWLPGRHTSKKAQEREQEADGIDWDWFDYLRGPGYAAQDERPVKDYQQEQPPLEMVEFSEGWPPPVDTN